MFRLLVSLLLLTAAITDATARTARNLSGRMRIDGFSEEFEADERMFGRNEGLDEPEESIDDSRWGENNDLNQIRITWDARNLYLAGDGRIWDNNMILFIDSTPGIGLGAMDSLTSWRRNFAFDTTGLGRGEGFSPDLFGATWDGNTSPRLIMQERLQRVQDYTVSQGFFSAAATFDKSNPGRAMELSIPWNTVFLGPVGRGTRDTVILVNGVPDTFPIFPLGSRLKIAGVVTAGGDGTGGPDVAPDNTRGQTGNAGDLVFLDNWATVEIDRNDDTGRGGGGPDGVADWDVSPNTRVSFRFRPPITAAVTRGLRFSLKELSLDRPAFSPEYGERMTFEVSLDPPPDRDNPFHQITTVELESGIYDVRGRFVRSLYTSENRNVLNLSRPAIDTWDGRDQSGEKVEPGIYVVRTVLKPNLSRASRAFVVVR